MSPQISLNFSLRPRRYNALRFTAPEFWRKTLSELCLICNRCLGECGHAKGHFRYRAHWGGCDTLLIHFHREEFLRYLDRLQPLGLLVARLALGIIMVAHGYHKVFGGLHHHVQFVASLGMPAWLGYVSTFAEFLGGILILAGFFTRAAAFAIFIDLAVAIWKVHWHNGLMGSSDRPGYEFPLAAAALAFVLIFFGASPISLDHVLRGGGTGAFKR
jgi:putative oxidoreductase